MDQIRVTSEGVLAVPVWPPATRSHLQSCSNTGRRHRHEPLTTLQHIQNVSRLWNIRHQLEVNVISLLRTLLCPARLVIIFPNWQWQGRLCRNLFDGKFQLKILFYHALNSSLLGLSLIWCVIFYNKSNFHPNTFIVDLAAPLHFLPPQATTQVTGEILQCLKLIFTEPFLFQWRVQSSSFSFNRVTRLHNSPSPPPRKWQYNLW